MLRPLVAVGLLIACLSGFVTTSSAKEKGEPVVGEAVASPIVITPELVEAHHAYQLAQLRWQQYRFVRTNRPHSRPPPYHAVRLSTHSSGSPSPAIVLQRH